MEHYATEEQQVEAIKRFWKENGTAIIVGAVVGIGGLFGWRAYSDAQMAAKERTSVAYQQVAEKLADDQKAFNQLTDFAKQNSDSGYSVLAEFHLAKFAVERDDLDEAIKHLMVVAKGADENLANLANLRLARVYLAKKEPETALKTLESVKAEAFVGQVDELKGDAYQAQRLFDKARVAYSSALTLQQNNRVLKMKLDNLAQAAVSQG